MKAGNLFRLEKKDLIKLPACSRLFMLPDRKAAGYDTDSGAFVSSPALAVGAFLAPGHTATHSAAYVERADPKMLPLFSYAAAAFYKGSFCAAAVKIDKDIRHDSRFIDISAVRKSAGRIKKIFAANRLIPHLERCALVYGCPNAQNFFLGRFECPLPASPSCNASCAGCISFQKGSSCDAAQPRITFTPKPQEIAEVALFHLSRVKDAVLSFGQGCEGEPLLRAGLIEKSVRLIRRYSSRGVINMNTNGSKPMELRRILDAGLDSVRVSMNSCREEFYNPYYRPGGYTFGDVLRSIGAAKKAGVYVSINYLTMPGFTDSKREFAAFRKFLRKYGVDMVQWRNLNYDPMRYFQKIGARIGPGDMVGVREEVRLLGKEFPGLKMGYFNPALSKAGKQK
jgi:pyruvate-formate lyase-activating enzyme